MKEIIDRLRNDDDYYGSYGSQWLSASTLKKYLNGDCPKEDTPNSDALEFGRLFHQAILEPEKYSSEEVNNMTLDIAFLKNALEDSDDYQCMESVNAVEVPYIGEYDGIPLKCKVDAETDEVLIDLKTTSNINAIEFTSKRFGYHISAYQYYFLTGKLMHFLYVEKGSGKTKLVKPDESFYEAGRRDWLWAMRNYKQSLKKQWVYQGHSEMDEGRFEVENIPMKVQDGKLYAWIYKEEHQHKRL